ncbi:hypothetical protein MRBLRH8O_002239 [Agrobacterium radiobacter]|uniref:hypothetical protein n=1 Tax=Agrobacterium TaxID=357 RepID=UPI000D1D608A|nr:hypothetical protein [Agrobacterium sp. LAD9]
MNRIGFFGGSSIFELGSKSDVLCFFSILKDLGRGRDSYDVLTDRLFRKYIRLGEIDAAILIMNEAHEYFSKIQSGGFDWDRFGFNKSDTNLDTTLSNLSDVFRKYFEGFEYCVQSSRAFNDDWGIYKAVRVVVSDMPGFLVDKSRPLEEYDALGADEKPFWLR